MRFVTLVVASVVAVSSFCGCTNKKANEGAATKASAHEQALTRVITSLDECNALLASLQGPQDVLNAKTKIEAKLGNIRSAEKQLSALPELSEPEKKRLSAKFDPQLEARTAKLNAEVTRLKPAPAPMVKSMKSAGPLMEETAGGSVLVDSVKDTIVIIKQKVRKKMQVRTGAGAGAVRG